MQTLLWFIVAISILVVIHEYGHFWVARKCGVRVIRFSLGFGKPIWGFKDRYGTEFSVAPLPLGGYVKMLDEREAPVPPELYHESFNARTPWQKIAIAAAGPLANFLFAILAYWALFVAGTTGVVAMVGEVKPNTPASYAGVQVGDRIVEVNGHNASTWEDVSWYLLSFIGETTRIPVVVESADSQRKELELPVEHWMGDTDQPDPLGGLGIDPRRLTVPAVIAEVLPDGAAASSGLKVGDKIVAVDGVDVNDWYQWVELVRNAPERTLEVSYDRAGAAGTTALTPAARQNDKGETTGFAGVVVQSPVIPADWLVESSLDPLSAIAKAAKRTWELTVFTLESLVKMVTGDVSVKNLSGPITIAKVAGASASGGLESFIQFLALLSVSLGVLNLLPVPMLDGGHIVFSLIESATGKPLSERIQYVAMQVGMGLLLSLMAVAFYNDISRL
ncbi:RIP metalloprotease RseP [Parathalassolituus penaei]|uniref:Zinc metalloprotease n=1 Tax=Parathalassolituus penaei TaxID=2997323 RepID=A0A9X3EC23_9GAMM|nr:RIP metalloprotease RseP [Parathalassolituus penaei]MCY0964099.1 RIP metalloprotease RseP [Parathalassolituus penaei]